MARFSAIHTSLIILLTWVNYVYTAAGWGYYIPAGIVSPSLEQQIAQMRENLIGLNEVIEDRDSRLDALEEKIQQHVIKQEDLEAKLIRLAQLEIRVIEFEKLELLLKEKEAVIVALRKEILDRSNGPILDPFGGQQHQHSCDQADLKSNEFNRSAQFTSPEALAKYNQLKALLETKDKPLTTKAYESFPKSCEDLRNNGQTINGLYMIVADLITVVFCDFSKSPGDSAVQQALGYTPVISKLTLFSVSSTVSQYQQFSPITYDVPRINWGDGMNMATGIFTAPKSGVYQFRASGLVILPQSGFCESAKLTSYNYAKICLYYNDYKMMCSIPDNVPDAHIGKQQYDTFALDLTYYAAKGDRVWLQFEEMCNKQVISVMGNGLYFMFSGNLLWEQFL